jgi:hypothetical protein
MRIVNVSPALNTLGEQEKNRAGVVSVRAVGGTRESRARGRDSVTAFELSARLVSEPRLQATKPIKTSQTTGKRTVNTVTSKGIVDIVNR